MTEYVPDSVRDNVMELVLNVPENHICFDCGNKNPLWASAYLGILICFECAARHRGYGTHISFIRSINLDRWNKKQLKCMELSGNKVTKERFVDYGVPKTAGIFEYSHECVQKYKSEVAERVKEIMNMEIYTNSTKPSTVTETHNPTDHSANNLIKPMEEINFDDVSVEKNVQKVEEAQYREPTKFTNFAENINVKTVISTTSKNKRANTKIQKVDFDFNFDNFNDVNFSSFNGNQQENEKTVDSNLEQELSYSQSNKKKNKFEDEEEQDNSYKSKISKDEINKKFANKKAISSDDYARLEEDPSQTNQYKNKLNNMKFSQAISSSELYGESYDDDSSGIGSKLKDMALGFTLKAAEKAKEFKDKTSDLIYRIQNKYGNN